MRITPVILVTFVFVGLTVLMYSLHSAAAANQPVAAELEPNLGWLNTDKPLRFSDELAGHVVLLDFWTYCCINCMHVLPDLEYLEKKYADEPFIVIGVHSAKFDNESTREAIRNAIFRYDIHHPVVVDDEFRIWRRYGSRGWPTFVLIGADGNIIGQASGEGLRANLDQYIGQAIEDGRAAGTLASDRVEIVAEEMLRPATDLNYPGKVLADLAGRRIFIADSSNDRVVVASYPDADGHSRAVAVFGGGERGLVDGGPDESRFHDPQGMVLDEEANVLYVADTKNHALRAIDLTTNTVTTIAGTGEQVYDREGGSKGVAQGLNSPWALELSPDRNTLYIAMAGPHQLWQMDLESTVVRQLAGSGRENIVDGAAAEAQLAQPSGLALSLDDRRLYFADSEVSAVRYLDLESDTVETLIGVGLFDYGDVDGRYPAARLQHPLGVATLPTSDGERVLVADTYNHKVRIIDPDEKHVSGWAGSGRGAGADELGLILDEPAGLSLAFDDSGTATELFVADTNNHRVVRIDVATREWTEIMISGLDAIETATNATATTVSAALGQALTLSLDPHLEDGAKPTAEAPATVQVTFLPVRGQRMLPKRILQQTQRIDTFPIVVEIPPTYVSEGAQMLVELSFAYCFANQDVCLPADLAWIVEVTSGNDVSAVLSGS